MDMGKKELTTERLIEMTMDILTKRLVDECPHFNNPKDGNGEIKIIYKYENEPRVIDSFHMNKEVRDNETYISYPDKSYRIENLKNNLRTLYTIVSKYLNLRVIPQGQLTIVFQKGQIVDCKIQNEGVYRDLERSGKSKFNLDTIWEYDDEE